MTPASDRPEALALVTEAAAHSGGIILLVAPALRVAIAAARGASQGIPSAAAPRVYVVDSRLDRLAAILRELAKEGLAGEVTLYHGSSQDFFRDLPLSPDLLFADAAYPHSLTIDSATIRNHLPAGARLVLLNPTGSEFQEAIQAGLLANFTPHVGGGVFLTTSRCRATSFLASPRTRIILQGRLHERYFLEQQEVASGHTTVDDLTADVRGEFARQPGLATGYGRWPWVQESVPLPASLPSGRPWPKISIITPSFNQGAYVEETLLSVLNQNYPNVEHIVMDGGSTDATRSILDRYRDKLSHVTSEPDNGQSHAINKGMSLATGTIVTWLNSDDMLAPGALASIALAFDTNEADMIAGICRLYRNGNLEAQHITSCPDGPLPVRDLLDLDDCWNAGQFFYQPEVMFTRELWLRAGGYVNDWLHYSMDYDLWLRFAQAGARLHVIGRPVAWFRLHDEQKTHIASRFQAELVVCRENFLKMSGVEAETPPPPTTPRPKLRITMLNDIGPFFGAGIAHVRMARALAWAGHKLALISILDRSIVGFESTHYAAQEVLDRVVESRPDLVIVGNLHAAGADPFLVQMLSERFPTVLVLHDFWAITGRCAYPGPCDKYLTGCDHTCPTADEYPALAPAEITGAFAKKRLILGESGGPSILTNSHWATGIARQALASQAHAHPRTPPVEAVQLSFPLETLRPRDRRMCRDRFGLPQDRFIVLLSGSLTDPRKGGMAFMEALAALQLPNLLVVTLARPHEAPGFPVEVQQLGQINSQLGVAMLNSAADVVVAAATEETFGQVALEAIACGTPAVGFPASGIREAIRHGVTGLLADSLDPASLAEAVQYLYGRPDIRRDLAQWGRLYVENEWSEFSASRRLHLVLREVDRDGRLNLPRNVRFLAAEPGLPSFQVIARSQDCWRPLQGFSQLQHKVPEHRLDSYRWAFGPSAIAEVFALETGLHRILIVYRNPHPEQRIQIRCNGVECGSFALVHTGFSSGRTLVLNLHLEKGPNALQLGFSHWTVHQDSGQPQAIIVTDLVLEPVAAVDEIARQTSAQQMFGSVWGAADVTRDFAG